MAFSLFAAIDVGSYDVKMKIYEISSKNKINLIDQVRHVLEIGKDTYTEGKVSFDVINELCTTLNDFVEIMNSYKVTEYKAYSTSGLREASNCQIILDRIKVKTGITVEILSNSMQRFIGLKGLTFNEKRFNEIISDGTAIVDVGSGSIQISLFDNQKLITTRNLKLGSLRIRELLYSLSNDREHFDLLIDELIDNDIETFNRMFLGDRVIRNIIALGDNIVQFARKGNDNHIREDMSKKQFLDRFKTLTAKTPVQISDKLGISEEQASLLIPCVLVYKKMLEETDAQNIWIPACDLCDGIAVSYALNSKKISLEHNFEDDIISSVRMMADRYKTDMDYIGVLESNVLCIYDATKKLHGLNRRDRMILSVAAILSDIGKYISTTNAGECAYDIITNTEILGLSEKERLQVAAIVRNNAMSILDSNNETSDLALAKMTAILKLGTAIDRSHKQKFKNIKVNIKENEMYITAKTDDDITLEKGLFARKVSFFEEVFGITPVIKQSK